VTGDLNLLDYVFHEAGHAVMNEAFGCRVESIGISFDGAEQDDPEGTSIQDMNGLQGQQIGIVRTAGLRAESIHRNEAFEVFLADLVRRVKNIPPDHSQADGSEDPWASDVDFLTHDLSDFQLNLADIARETEKILRAQWPKVEAVADALLEKQGAAANGEFSLSGDEIRAAIASADGKGRE
jgi:hypothetical protein